MSRKRDHNRDPRLFRGDVVQCLNILTRDGTVLAYELSPRVAGRVEVPRISVQIPSRHEEAAVRRSLGLIPHFAELTNEVLVGEAWNDDPRPQESLIDVAPLPDAQRSVLQGT